MRLNELHSLCNYYKVHLGMWEWEIQVNFANTLPGTHVGIVTFRGKQKRAKIRILTQVGAKRKNLEVYDQEQTLVHELLHCRFDRVHLPNSPSYELALDSTATCIVNLRRQLSHAGN